MVLIANILVICVIYFRMAMCEQMLVKDVKLAPLDVLDKKNIIRTTANDPSELDESIFNDLNNIIVFQDSGTVILHSSKLNTVSRTVGIPNEIFYGKDEINALDQTWYEFRKSEYENIVTEFLPLTGCLNNEYGDGGKLGGTFSKTLGRTGSIDLATGFSTTYIKETFDYYWAIGSTAKISGSYTCNIAANNTGQMFIQFSYLLLNDCKMRKINVTKSRTFSSLLTLSNNLDFGMWETPNEEIKLLNYRTSPSFACVTNPEFLQCDTESIGDSYQF